VPREGLALCYRLHFGAVVEPTGFGRAVATRVEGHGQPNARFEVDFQLPDAEALTGPIELELSAPDSEVLSRSVERSPQTGGVRARFELKRADAGRLRELRAYLRAGNDVLTETWSYPWQPSQ
jgi:glucans biosynthesis protein